jgi:hypothetical protein
MMPGALQLGRAGAWPCQGRISQGAASRLRDGALIASGWPLDGQKPFRPRWGRGKSIPRLNPHGIIQAAVVAYHPTRHHPIFFS